MTKLQLDAAGQKLLREIPSVDRLLKLPISAILVEQYGHDLTAEALRTIAQAQRTAVIEGQRHVAMNAMMAEMAREWLEDLLAPSLRAVVNGTGIIVHTNLGRAPLSEAALSAVQSAAGGYSTLEYDPVTGQRGSRTDHTENLLTRLTGAEAALAVNNNAAAVMLMLTALCSGKEVLISRGQLVEIGGGFRVPDVMAASGAKLIEVGTTNRTHLRDFESAIGENCAAILVAHPSNYKIMGFTTEPSLSDLSQLAQKHDILLLYDQGSGALLDVAQFGLESEPTVLDGLASQCDVVAFSGDKLLGGPQAGILCGGRAEIDKMKRHPLARAVRADKMCIAALSATLTHYLSGKALVQIPIWQMISYKSEALSAKAADWVQALRASDIPARSIEGESMVGGGSLPGTRLPTTLVAIDLPDVEKLAAMLRAEQPPIIGRIQDNTYLIDPRTVLPQEEDLLIQSLVGQCLLLLDS